jgi:inner membrane protein
LDNVSHTIAGLLVAEAALVLRARRGAAPSRSFARTAYWLSAVCNNLSDLDGLYAGITQPRTLGYLLHHRGHTHTLLVALASAALVVALWQLLARRFGQVKDRADWLWLWALGLSGSALHIALDFTNNYGVHPFWPLYGGWFYGDLVFIVEPLFFALGVPPLLASFRSLWARGVFGVVLVAVLALAWAVDWMPFAVAFTVSVVALISLWFSLKLGAAQRLALTFSAALLFVLVLGAARFAAQIRASASLPAAATLEDIVLTPMPANPLCWSVWRLSSQGDELVAERGAVAPLPALLSVARCSIEPNAGTPTAGVTPAVKEESDAVRWTGRHVASATALRTLAKQNCFAAAFLRWSRLPFVAPLASGSGGTVVGDLRYDRAPELEFAEFTLPEGRPCPRWVPDWTPPRQEVLGGSQP